MELEIVMEEKGIRNLHPRPGEPDYLTDQFPTGLHEDGQTFVLISLTSGVGGVGHVLSFSGSQSPASIAAAQWDTDPILANNLANRLKKQSGKVPNYYQVVFGVRFKDGIPVEAPYLFHRELQEPQ